MGMGMDMDMGMGMGIGKVTAVGKLQQSIEMVGKYWNSLQRSQGQMQPPPEPRTGRDQST